MNVLAAWVGIIALCMVWVFLVDWAVVGIINRWRAT